MATLYVEGSGIIPAFPFLAHEAMKPGDPVVLNADGEVAICAADATLMTGWTLDGATAALDTTHVALARDGVHWVLPPTATGTWGTTALQTTAGATPTTLPAAMSAAIGQESSLEGSTGAWTVNPEDTNDVELFVLVGWVYNIAKQLWMCDVVINQTDLGGVGGTEI
jgi:hypothetical protein